MQYLSAAEVESLSDEDLDSAVWHHILHVLHSDRADWSEQQLRIAALPDKLRQFYAMWTVELQVHNGGFNQYFFNCGDAAIPDVVSGYQSIGAFRLAELAQQAADAYQAEFEIQERTKALVQTEGWQAFADSYEQTTLVDFDTPFYKAEREEQVTVLRSQYLREHSEEFDLSKLESCWDPFAGRDPEVLDEFNMPTQRPDWIDPCPLRKR